jgi:hypothetical protein
MCLWWDPGFVERHTIIQPEHSDPEFLAAIHTLVVRAEQLER